jgi:hypothetical protein
VADLWFHSMIALAHYGLSSPADVVAELARREGLSGLEEKALRKAQARENANKPVPHEHRSSTSRPRHELRSLNTVGWISYVLHLIVAVARWCPARRWAHRAADRGAGHRLVKRATPKAPGRPAISRWRIRSVLWAGVLYLVTLPLWFLLLLPGWLAWAVISIWFLYRIVKGMVRMNASQPMPEKPSDP